MNEIMENIRLLAPFVYIPWALLFIFAWLRPQRFINSFLLMAACGFTLLFICGLFGEYMSQALVCAFLLVMLILFLVPMLLIANGIKVVKKECFSLANLLSLILGVGIGIGEIATAVYVIILAGNNQHYALNRFSLFISLSVIYFSVIVLSFVFYSVFIQIVPHFYKFDYVIIHGCGLIDGYKMSKLLSNRIDKAIQVYNRCKVKPMLIASGGQGGDEKISEAQAIHDYLVEKGIPEEHIILENKSTTTMENLIFSKQIVEDRGGKKRIALVSSNYHVYRCLIYAKSLSMKCVGIGAKVALYYWPSALIREFIAVFTRPKFVIFTLLGYLIVIAPLLSELFR